jgi:sulfur-oxidizing protein SoxZ
MKNTTKIRATLENGVTTVKLQVLHPMDTGLFKDAKTGNVIPAYFIKELKCEHNGKLVLEALWGIAVSKNPYLSFSFEGGAAGDTVKVSWTDNKEMSGSGEAQISAT